MSPFTVADLRHLEPDDPTVELPPRVERLRQFLGGIAWAASVRPSGEPSPTALPCRRRPDRRPCRGLIEVFRQDIPPAVEWRCPMCEDGGIISGWRGTSWDLGRLLPPPVSEAEGLRMIELLATEEEYALLRSAVTFTEPEAERIAAAAMPGPPGRVRLQGRLAGWDALIEDVGVAGDEAGDWKLQDRLDDLHGLVIWALACALKGG